MSCLFCSDPARAGSIVYEDDRTWVILHEDWSPRGHAMVVARRHVENASDLTHEELAHLTRVWQAAERVLLEVTGAERAILLKLGIATPHLHLHIYPVRSTHDRAEVFAMFDGARRAAKDDAMIERIRELLQLSLTPPPR